MHTDQTDMIAESLHSAGYHNLTPTYENLVECFLDYVDAGYFSNLSLEDAQEEIQDGSISIRDMCKALSR